MGLEQRITCDACERDLTYTGNSINYRLHLKNEEMPVDPRVNAVTYVMIYPSIKKDAYFCGMSCLKEWAGK